MTTPLGRDAGPHPRLLDATMFWSRRGGGVRRYVIAKRAWLRREAGWSHALLAPGARGPHAVDAGGMPLPASGGYRLPLDWHRLARRMAEIEPDLIEVGDPFAMAWAARRAAARLRVPCIAFCHGNTLAMARQLGGGDAAERILRRYLRRVYAGFDLVLAPSRAMTEVLRGLGIAQVQQQPLGVDTLTFHPSRRDPGGVRQALGLGAGERLLVYAGRFAPEKHLDVLADAVRRLGPGHTLLAIGHGPAPPQGERVRLLPFEPRPSELARLVASGDAFVHAGDQETFGLAALEAMACGVPLVARAAAGLAELVEDGCGVGVGSSRVEDWAEALAALLAAPPDAARLRRARERAEAHDWSRVLAMLLARYQRLLLGESLFIGEVAALAPCPR